VGAGDWYARNMYIEGSEQYRYHVERFGPQYKVGYKELIGLFTADKWDPDALMDLYCKAGAKYFFSMGVHHDNFDLWNSKYQPRWNSVTRGPRKDIVGIWAQAARKRGLRFGVSEHLSNSFDWFAPSHLSDSTGAYKDMPYDGSNQEFADLYHDYSDQLPQFARMAQPMGRIAPERWKKRYFLRVKDLIDQHQPDLLYTDGGIPFEQFGLSTVAELYNVSAAKHSGRSDAVYYSKVEADCVVGTCVLDRERGVLDGISSHPWQTDTCIGDWHYKEGITYKSAKKVIDLLVDIVSKNGNLLLNFPLPANGELDSEERQVLRGITEWMSINGQGIYGSRPWTIYGEGPSMAVHATAGMNEGKQPDLTARDYRFTQKGDSLFVFAQGWPGSECVVKALGLGSRQAPRKVAAVHLLGGQEHLVFKQRTEALHVSLPEVRPVASDIGVALHVLFE
jgi:alpha-L-fucosidase